MKSENDQFAMREFVTGATRHTDLNKLDYEGFLSPLALKCYAEYMNGHRVQADGNLRDSDNWQMGIPRDVYIKSLWRHFMDMWMLHRGYPDEAEDATIVNGICGVIFNAFGYLHELLIVEKMHNLVNDTMKNDGDSHEQTP